MSTQETITPIPIRVRTLSPCMVCLETFPKKTLIKDGTCDDGICKSCIKGITNGKCPNCREVYPWWSTQMDEKITDEQVEHWLGSDWSFSNIVETLRELANGEYEQEQLRKDISDTWEGE